MRHLRRVQPSVVRVQVEVVVLQDSSAGRRTIRRIGTTGKGALEGLVQALPAGPLREAVAALAAGAGHAGSRGPAASDGDDQPLERQERQHQRDDDH